MNDAAGLLPPGIGGVPDDLGASAEIRLTRLIFSRIFGDAPDGVWRAPGALMLVGSTTEALTVALPWGSIVAVARAAAPVLDAYSMNRHTEAFQQPLGSLRPDAVPRWAVPCAHAVLDAGRIGGVRVVVNRELPEEIGLLTGAETACALGKALVELYGARLPVQSPDPWYALALKARKRTIVLSHSEGEELLPFDLVAAGLRLLIIDVGATEAPPGASAAPGFGGDVTVAAAVLRNGEPSRLGPLLSEAHESGVEVLDKALSAAWSAGALGGRAIGSCLVVLAPMSAVPAIRFSVTDELSAIARRPPRFLTVVPASGTCRVL